MLNKSTRNKKIITDDASLNQKKFVFFPFILTIAILIPVISMTVMLFSHFIYWGRYYLMIPLVSLYRIPIIAFFSILPTFLYFNAETIPLFDWSVRGFVHLILTSCVVVITLHLYDQLASMNAVMAILMIMSIYMLGRTTAFLVYMYYRKSLNEKLMIKYKLWQKETEQQSLQYYMHELEQQQLAIRKFKHDYQNILFSFDIFVKEDDWEGMKQFYARHLSGTSDIIAKSNFALERLGKIKVREIKGIIAAKFMTAQNMGISATFAADEDIDEVPADSVAMVRMLGIILDNAIEELARQDNGTLLVACYKNDQATTFVVQNTCRLDTPDLFILKQEGFSTKGKGRGLGLSNLSTLADSQPNIVLCTSISDGNFTQKLSVSTP